ncbi:hypothetical protein [Paraliomyxa miuraensis]|uniref:hypothetical protein n=1 Tax=Paraliomyxa miuraensis TaxID=376150 RepID=UPI002251976C|nr:hypothetical protein [Paraliomyxa miuraensis]MCX4246299.1 hypothetical protein [Paraliomyxa miuraensis]
MRSSDSASAMVFLGLVLGLSACDSGTPKIETPPPTKSLSDLKQSTKTDMTPEELEEARRKAGFKDKDELAEENIAVMKKGEREYVKAHLAEHRDLLKSVRGMVDKVEKEAPKWAKAKDAAKAFEKFSEKFKEETKAADESFKKLLEGGGAQIDIQAKLVGAMRNFELLSGDLGPEISAEESFTTAIADLRKELDGIDEELTAIEKDESLKVVEGDEPEGD